MIRYIEEHQVFILETKSTQYAMCVRPDGHLEHCTTVAGVWTAEIRILWDFGMWHMTAACSRPAMP